MKPTSARITSNQVPVSALVPFIVITYGLAWTIFALLIFFTTPVVRVFGAISGHNPLFILSVYAPAIAAISLVVWHTGLAGLRGYLSRLFIWRCSIGWSAFLLLGIPAIFMIGAVMKGNLSSALPFDTLQAAMAAIGFMLVLGPVEELGWRGFALPLLQRKLAPVWAGLVLGVLWAVWHLPAFFLSGTPQNAWGIAPFMIGAVAVSMILTPLFNQSNGSIFLAALFHFQLNNPLWPDAQPYDMFIFTAVAVIVVWVNRAALSNRNAGVTRVIPSA